MNRKANLLLVENDSEFVRWATGVMSRAGHRLVTVDRGSQALERLRAQTFDMAIVALDLADTSGLEVLRQMKAASPET